MIALLLTLGCTTPYHCLVEPSSIQLKNQGCQIEFKVLKDRLTPFKGKTVSDPRYQKFQREINDWARRCVRPVSPVPYEVYPYEPKVIG